MVFFDLEEKAVDEGGREKERGEERKECWWDFILEGRRAEVGGRFGKFLDRKGRVMVMRCVFHGVRNVYLHSGFVRLPHRKVHTLSSLPSTLCTLPTRWNDHVITAKRYRKKGKGREKTALAAARVDHLEDAVDGEDGFDIDAHHEQMESTFHALQRTFGALRSSGASTSMLDSTAATVPPPLWLF